MANKLLSIVIPTYSGADTVGKVLESIATQPEVGDLELIIMIDGPNDKLRTVIDRFMTDNKKYFRNSIIEQFKVNQGRFIARYEGAKLASAKKLLFIDDRTELTSNYIENIFNVSRSHKVIISNIIEEKSQANFVGNTLSFIRSKLYKNWGSDFEPYEIDSHNFDKSPKGTAGLCIDKDIFIESAQEFIDTSGEVTTNSNDDTKLLRLIVKRTNLYRSAAPKLIYIPRGTAASELTHIYKRGPMFVDYYLAKDSPYFRYLIGLYALSVPCVVAVVMWPVFTLLVLLFAVIALFMCGVLLSSGRLLQRLSVGTGLVVVPLSFVAGIYVGTLYKLKSLFEK